MSVQPNGDYLAAACGDDVPELAALARAELPTMTALHGEAGWQTYNRFGNGQRARGNCTFVLRNGGPDGQLIGFVWADDAMYVDYDIVEPWWCVNAVAIAPPFRGMGRGTALIAEVASVGSQAGVVLLYGQSVPTAVAFWEGLGFLLADVGEPLRTSSPARRRAADPAMLTAQPGLGDRFFVKYLTNVPGSVRSALLPMSKLQPS